MHPVVTLIAAALVAGCSPSEQQKAQWAKEKRLHCLEHYCEGDRPPQVAPEMVVQKLNGEWYVAPREYFGGFGQAGFEWWEHKPLRPSAKRPVALQADVSAGKGYDYAVEIFFIGRQRWIDSNEARPWDHDWWGGRVAELEAKGLRMERVELNPELERVRFFRTDGTPYEQIYYLATGRQRIRGSGAPVLACNVSAKPHPNDSCSGGDYWQPDVFARYRFRTRHAHDWPAIHDEIVRVLNLAHKAHP
jgi:hypothetical protein